MLETDEDIEDNRLMKVIALLVSLYLTLATFVNVEFCRDCSTPLRARRYKCSR